MPSLQELQDLFFKSITRWNDEEEAAARLKQGDGPSAMERLEVYQVAYRARLKNCVVADFPATKKILGDEKFNSIMKEFFDSQYSELPNINEFTQVWLNYFVKQEFDNSVKLHTPLLLKIKIVQVSKLLIKI